MHHCGVPISAESCSDYIDRHYRTIQNVVRRVAHRHRLNRDECDELHSRLHLRLVQNDYALLRAFRGQCPFPKYLTIVVERLRLDGQTSVLGRWRPSMRAARLGSVAVLLERLLTRDRLPFEAACEVLRTTLRIRSTNAELDALRSRLPVRVRRPWLVSLDESAALPDLVDRSAPPERDESDIDDALARALASLPACDRHLIHLRFQDRHTVARIARDQGLDQKSLYRRYDAIYGRLRTAITSETRERPRLPAARARM